MNASTQATDATDAEEYPVEEVLLVKSFPQLQGAFREASLHVLEDVLAEYCCTEHDRHANITLLDQERVRVRTCCPARVEKIVSDIEGLARA
jgi:hypothetical protein